MKCPQCQRENQFPVPGLCPDCYKLWKDGMRARYGPGPWPAMQQLGEVKEGPSVHQEQAEALKQTAASNDSSIERTFTAVLERLQNTDNTSAEFLTQIDGFLRAVTCMLAAVTVEPQRKAVNSSR